MEAVDAVRTQIKLKYPKLKRLGYKLCYGDKSDKYLDLFFERESEDGNFEMRITEKYIYKRMRGVEDNLPLTLKEVVAVAEIANGLILK